MSERFNVTGMLVGPEESDSRFNPFRDITPEQREGMEREREMLWARSYWDEFTETLIAEIILGSKVRLSPERLAILADAKYKHLDWGQWEWCVTKAVAEKFLHVPLSISDSERKRVQEITFEIQGKSAWPKFLRMVTRQAIAGMQFPLRDSDKKVLQSLNYALPMELAGQMDFAANARIMHVDVPLPEGVMSILKLAREEAAEQKAWNIFAQCAKCEAILSADEVIVPPGGGLELVFPQRPSQSEEMSLPPSRRTF